MRRHIGYRQGSGRPLGGLRALGRPSGRVRGSSPGERRIADNTRDPEIQGPPVLPALSLVVAGSTAPAAPAAALGRPPRTDVDDDGFRLFVEVDRLDHRRPVDTEQFALYVGSEHAILLAEFSGPSSTQDT